MSHLERSTSDGLTSTFRRRRRSPARAALCVVGSLICTGSVVPSAQAADPPSLSALKTWPSDGWASHTVISEGKAYSVGSFSRLAPPTGDAVLTDTSTGSVTADPKIDGAGNSIPDGAGGAYIAGGSRVAGAPKRDVIRLKTDGSLDPSFSAPAFISEGDAGYVSEVARSGNTLYVGGVFDHVDGQARNNLAALDATTGAVLPWTADATFGSGPGVTSIAVSGESVFFTGSVSKVGAASRLGGGAVAATDGHALPWDPQINWYDAAADPELAPFGDRVYLTGYLVSVGGQSRSGNLAAVDATSGAILPWAPSMVGNGVRSIAISQGVLYVGGHIMSVNGSARSHLAAFDAANGALTSWNPGTLNGNYWGPKYGGQTEIYTVAAGPTGSVFVGGEFTTIGGTHRPQAAQISASGQLTSWKPAPIGAPRSIVAGSGGVFLTGNLEGAGAGVSRNRVVAVDLSTGAPTSWNPGASLDPAITSISDIAVRGSTAYIGSNISPNGQTRGRLTAHQTTGSGAVDPALDTGTALNGSIADVAVTSDAVYVNGGFSSVGAASRDRFAAWSSTGALLPWNPSFSGENWRYAQLEVGASAIYLRGSFTAVNGVPRTNLAAVDRATGATLSWNPAAGLTAGGVITDIAVGTDAVYVGGKFTSLSGEPRKDLAAVDPVSGAVQSWTPPLVGGTSTEGVAELALDGSTLHLSFRWFNSSGPKGLLQGISTTTGAELYRHGNDSGATQTWGHWAGIDAAEGWLTTGYAGYAPSTIFKPLGSVGEPTVPADPGPGTPGTANPGSGSGGGTEQPGGGGQPTDGALPSSSSQPSGPPGPASSGGSSTAPATAPGSKAPMRTAALTGGKVAFSALVLKTAKAGKCPKSATVVIASGKSRTTKKLKVTKVGSDCQLSGSVSLTGKLGKAKTVKVTITGKGLKTTKTTVKST